MPHGQLSLRVWFSGWGLGLEGLWVASKQKRDSGERRSCCSALQRLEDPRRRVAAPGPDLLHGCPLRRRFGEPWTAASDASHTRSRCWFEPGGGSACDGREAAGPRWARQRCSSASSALSMLSDKEVCPYWPVLRCSTVSQLVDLLLATGGSEEGNDPDLGGGVARHVASLGSLCMTAQAGLQ